MKRIWIGYLIPVKKSINYLPLINGMESSTQFFSSFLAGQGIEKAILCLFLSRVSAINLITLRFPTFHGFSVLPHD